MFHHGPQLILGEACHEKVILSVLAVGVIDVHWAQRGSVTAGSEFPSSVLAGHLPHVTRSQPIDVGIRDTFVPILSIVAQHRNILTVIIVGGSGDSWCCMSCCASLLVVGSFCNWRRWWLFLCRRSCGYIVTLILFGVVVDLNLSWEDDGEASIACLSFGTCKGRMVIFLCMANHVRGPNICCCSLRVGILLL